MGIALGIHQADTEGAHSCAGGHGNQASSCNVRDFAHESLPSRCDLPEVFEPLAPPIATDWSIHNLEKNHGMLSGKALLRLIKVGWFSMCEVTKRVHVRKDPAPVQYSDHPDEERYPFDFTFRCTHAYPSWRVRMYSNNGFRSGSHSDDPITSFSATTLQATRTKRSRRQSECSLLEVLYSRSASGRLPFLFLFSPHPFLRAIVVLYINRMDTILADRRT
ncbi:hypothetical protein EI94DRAFT_1746262 [Lactarius quietus]|nr:hypothetical protein EI94DRAFT_1746262 [Lactarius quietus]